jgi:hypothetical protein
VASEDLTRLYWRLFIGDVLWWLTLLILPGLILALLLDLDSAILIRVAGLLLGLILLISALSARPLVRQMEEVLSRGHDVTELVDDMLERRRGPLFGLQTPLNEILAEIAATAGDEYAKEDDGKGGMRYRTRGKDSKGPARGGGADTFDQRNHRIDALVEHPEFDGLEDELSEAEKMVEEANKRLDKTHADAWLKAEAKDEELIESGFERLGDLVASGHYGGPQRDSERNEKH